MTACPVQMSGLAHSGVRGRSPCTTGVEVRRTSGRVRDEALLNSQWNLNYIGVRSFIRSGAPLQSAPNAAALALDSAGGAVRPHSAVVAVSSPFSTRPFAGLRSKNLVALHQPAQRQPRKRGCPRRFSFPQPGGLSGDGPCGHAVRNQLRELLRRAVERFEA